MPDRFKVTKAEEVGDNCYECDDAVTGKLLYTEDGIYFL